MDLSVEINDSKLHCRQNIGRNLTDKTVPEANICFDTQIHSLEHIAHNSISSTSIITTHQIV